MNEDILNITFAIIGPVSVGKSTLLNAICSNTFSDMKKRKTTMLPQIYNVVKTDDYDTYDEIYNKNKESNDNIYELRKNDDTFSIDDFKPITHKIKSLHNFIDFQTTTYSILDMPGLNCGGKTLYYDYIKNNKNIDIYILLFDINSCLNTTDEINILNMIKETILQNKYGYVYILINKCDDMTIDENNNINIGDDELNNYYEQCLKIIDDIFKDEITYFISPISTYKLYIYRNIFNNMENINEDILDNYIKEKCGRDGFKTLNNFELKLNYVKNILNDEDFENNIKQSGYNIFTDNINLLLVNNFSKILNHKIETDLISLCDDITIDDIVEENIYIDDILTNLECIITRIDQSNSNIFMKLTIPDNFKDLIRKIYSKIMSYIKYEVENICDDTDEKFIDHLLKIIDLIYEHTNKLIELYDYDCFKYKSALQQRKHTLYSEKITKCFDKNLYKTLCDDKKKYVDSSIFIQCIRNTIKLNNVDILSELIESIDNYVNANDFIDIFIDEYMETENIDNVIEILNIIFNKSSILLYYNISTLDKEQYKNDISCNDTIILNIIFILNKFICTHKYHLLFKNWLNMNWLSITQNNNIIKYIFFQLDNETMKHKLKHNHKNIDLNKYTNFMIMFNTLYDSINNFLKNNSLTVND